MPARKKEPPGCIYYPHMSYRICVCKCVHRLTHLQMPVWVSILASMCGMFVCVCVCVGCLCACVSVCVYACVRESFAATERAVTPEASLKCRKFGL